MASASNSDNNQSANAATQCAKEENESTANTFAAFTAKAKLGLSSLQERLKGSNAETKDSRLSMAGLLKQARISFEKWVEQHNPQDYPMPNGIVFLTSIKGSFGWGGEFGTGIVLYRLDNSKSEEKETESKEQTNGENNKKARWSGPCAIGSGGVSFGLQIGISKVDHIIMLPRKHHVKTFTSKGQLKLGGSSELTVINVGGKAQGSINIGTKDLSDIHSYSLDTKGLLIGVNVEGAVIGIRGDCNDAFYGKAITVEQIANGEAEIPENHSQNNDYLKIIELLNKHFTIYKRGPHSGPRGPPPPMGPFCAVPPPPHRPHHGPHAPHRPHRPHHPHPHPPHPQPHANDLNSFQGKPVPPSEPEPQQQHQIENMGDVNGNYQLNGNGNKDKNENENNNSNNNNNDENEFEIVEKVINGESDDDDMELDDSDQIEGKITPQAK